MEIRDRNGLTEAEFLACYQQKDYPRPSLTVDVVVFKCAAGPQPESVQVLLVKRGGHPFLGCWAFPGGFVNPDEDADAAAARELAEETGVSGLKAHQLGLFSAPGRDPRGWTVSEAYVARVADGASVKAGDDADDAQWFDLEVARRDDGLVALRATWRAVALSALVCFEQGGGMLPDVHVVEASGLAFDHADILAHAVAYQAKLEGWQL